MLNNCAMAWQIIEPRIQELARHLRAPTSNDNKYSRGVLGVIAGSDEYPGAALLNIEAAIRTGVGLVRYLGTSDLVQELLSHRPEIVLMDGTVDCYLAGSGISNSNRTLEITTKIESAINLKLPVILDAGALELASPSHEFQLLTPHYGELIGLMSQYEQNWSLVEVQNEPESYAIKSAEILRANVLLKGHTTYIADYFSKKLFVVSDLNSRLATAGTGDVLAGIIASLIAQKKDLDFSEFAEVATLGVLLHAQAAEQLAKNGPFAALDLTYAVSQIIAQYLANI